MCKSSERRPLNRLPVFDRQSYLVDLESIFALVRSDALDGLLELLSFHTLSWKRKIVS